MMLLAIRQIKKNTATFAIFAIFIYCKYGDVFASTRAWMKSKGETLGKSTSPPCLPPPLWGGEQGVPHRHSLTVIHSSPDLGAK